ncbi:MAG: NADH-quinone oxidoreductase subunit N [Thermoleophilia bacterium]|nr:NADH-quinone oxidoreductase subunit N [Thermoleophilia bacterium]
MQAPDLIPVIPELILLVAACLVLLVEPFLKPGAADKGSPADKGAAAAADKTAVLAIALTGIIGSIVVSLALTGQARVSFAGMLTLDDWAVFFKVLFGLGAAITILMSPRFLEAHRRHLGEYYALLLFALIGMDLMAAARDFILLYVALELMAISSYLLAAFFRYRERSNESALKYFLTGSFASAIMLYGISLVYAEAGATNYADAGRVLAGLGNDSGVLLAVFLVAIGLAFKVSAAPFHMWTPDVYQGAPTPVAAFFSVGPKAAAFSAIIAAFIVAFPGTVKEWGLLFIVLSIATMLAGNLWALVQTNIKRMLAFSSIAHAGYLLTGLGAMGRSGNSLPGRGMLVYLAAYTFMNLGAFGILAYLKTQMPDKFDYSLKQLAGLGRRSPWAAVLLSLFLLSLTGIPGTAGFIGKFYVFSGVVWADLWWLAVIGVLLSAVSAYYYLRVIIYMFFKEPEEEYAIREPISGGMAMALSVSAIATLVIGLVPSWLWDAAVGAVRMLFD